MVWAGAIISIALLWLGWAQKQSRASRYIVSVAGTWPASLVFCYYVLALPRGSSVGEVIFPLMVMSLLGSIFGALVLGALWRALAEKGAVAETLSGISCALLLGPSHFLFQNPTLGFGKPGLGTLVLLSASGAIALGIPIATGFLGMTSLKDGPKRGLLVPLILCLIPFGWSIPSALFRVQSVPAFLQPLADIGARRAVDGDARYSGYAKIYLAEHGDQAMMGQLREEVKRGDANPLAPFPADLLSRSNPDDARTTDALRSALEAELNRYKVDNTYGDEERRIEDLCQLLGQRRDPKAVELLHRAYNINPTLMNFRETAATALSRIPGDEAGHVCAVELAKLHPNLHKNLINEFRRHPGEEVRLAALKKDQEYQEWSKAKKVADMNVPQLAAAKDADGLFLKTKQRSGGSQNSDAAFALVRMRDPRRAQGIRNALPMIAYRGAELRGTSDPDLARQLCAGADKDLHLLRFLGDWAPPEAESTLRRALVQYSLQQAAIGLGRIGTDSALDAILFMQGRATASTSLQITLMVAMSLTGKPAAAATLKKSMNQPETGPALISDGAPVYASDVAALCLERMGEKPAHTFKADRSGTERWMQFVLR